MAPQTWVVLIKWIQLTSKHCLVTGFRLVQMSNVYGQGYDPEVLLKGAHGLQYGEDLTVVVI